MKLNWDSYLVSFLLLVLALEMVVHYKNYEPETQQQEFICTDSSCEKSEVPGGASPIPNLYDKEFEEFPNV